jgi:hypothetical protein
VLVSLRVRLLVGVALLAAVCAGAAPAGAKLPPSRPVTIAWGGDTTLGSSYGRPPDRGWPLLRGIAPLLGAADISAVNNEGTYGSGGTSKCGSGSSNCFAFQAPAANAATLKRAGVDIANLANNHAYDYGASGRAQTVRALAKQGIPTTGAPGQITLLHRPGVTVAFVGFSAYHWTASITNLAGVRSLVRRARKRANLVVAFVHAGAEGADQIHTPNRDEVAFGEHRGNVRAFAHTAVDAGADLVLGSGPHVLRGMEVYKRRLIAYSLGNLAGYKNFGTGGNLSLSGILRATVDGTGRILAARLESLRLDGTAIPHVDRTHAAARLVSSVSRSDFGRRGVSITAGGAVVLPGG